MISNVKLLDFEAIFWDFDGVIMDSNQVREDGFRQVLVSYPEEQVVRLLEYHRLNGGLSRYVKFRYFFETIRGESITEQDVEKWAGKFSKRMLESLVNPAMLISEIIQAIEKYHSMVPMYIVSGSDQTELRFLAEQLHINSWFKRIHGSPVPKKEWVSKILQEEEITPNRAILIGDSINDWDAAEQNGLHFYGYNGTPEVLSKSTQFLNLQE